MLYFTDFTEFYHIINDHDIVPRLLGQNPAMPKVSKLKRGSHCHSFCLIFHPGGRSRISRKI